MAEHGPEVLSSPAALSNLLSDLLPDSPRIAEIPAAAAQDQIADELREHTSVGMDTRTASRLAASSFAEATMFAPEACAWVVDEFARALGLASDGAAAAALLTSTVPDSSLMNQERSSISAEHLIPKPEDSGAGPAGSGPPSQDSGTMSESSDLIPAPASPRTPTDPAWPTTWTIEIAADRDYFDAAAVERDQDAPPIEFPEQHPSAASSCRGRRCGSEGAARPVRSSQRST